MGESDQPGVSGTSLQWRVQPFDRLDIDALYEIMAVRVAVFVVEQDCPYQELDGLDDRALHLGGWSADGRLAAYARLLPPGVRFDRPSIGRVLTAGSHRRRGLGRELMRRAIAAAQAQWPGAEIRISAQRHLEAFYGGLGFRIDSAPYDEDGIPHVDMRLPSPG